MMMPTGGGRNWAGIIAALAAVGIGAYAVYWLWQNGYFDGNGGTECTNPTGSEGSTLNCGISSYGQDPTHKYKCTDKKWADQGVNPDCGSLPCQHLLPGDDPGYGFPTGWRKCDPVTNELCQWNDTSKQWSLIQAGSQICIDNVEQQKCYTSTASNIVTCGLYASSNPDECAGSYATGCPCSTGDCRPVAYCCEDNVCHLKADASYLFYATPSNSNLTCWRNGNERWAEYQFDETGLQLFREAIAFNSIIELKVHLNGNQIGPFDAAFYRGYNGAWTDIWDFDCANAWCCIPSCNPIYPEYNGQHIWTSSSGPHGMDSFRIGIASPTGPPDITAIECKFGFG